MPTNVDGFEIVTPSTSPRTNADGFEIVGDSKPRFNTDGFEIVSKDTSFEDAQFVPRAEPTAISSLAPVTSQEVDQSFVGPEEPETRLRLGERAPITQEESDAANKAVWPALKQLPQETWDMATGAMDFAGTIAKAIPADVAFTLSRNFQNVFKDDRGAGNLLAALKGEPLPFESEVIPAAAQSAQERGEFPAAAAVGQLSQDLAATAPLILGFSILPKAAQVIIGGAFTYKMLTDAPHTFAKLGEEMGKPESERDPTLIAQLVSQGAQEIGFGGMGLLHGTKMGKQAVERFFEPGEELILRDELGPVPGTELTAKAVAEKSSSEIQVAGQPPGTKQTLPTRGPTSEALAELKELAVNEIGGQDNFLDPTGPKLRMYNLLEDITDAEGNILKSKGSTVGDKTLTGLGYKAKPIATPAPEPTVSKAEAGEATKPAKQRTPSQQFNDLVMEHAAERGWARNPDALYTPKLKKGEQQGTASIQGTIAQGKEMKIARRNAAIDAGITDLNILDSLDTPAGRAAALEQLREHVEGNYGEDYRQKTRKPNAGQKDLNFKDEPFKLKQETTTDAERVAAEKAKAAQDAAEAKRIEAEQQQDLLQTAKKSDAFDRAANGEEAAFDDLDSQFRNTYPDPEELSARGQPNPNQVFTAKQFADKFNRAFAARDFDTILDTIKATSDVSVWKPFLKDLFKAQAKDPVAYEKAEWMRHVFNGTRPDNAIPRPPPRPTGTHRPPPPVTPTPRPKPGQSPPPKPPPTPPSPPPDRIPVDPISGGGAKSPFKIIGDFSRSIGKAIQVRRLKRNTLGTYSPGSTLTAEKFAGDLDTAAHELAGHWVDDKHGIGKPWIKAGTRSPYDAELAKFWIHGSVTPKSTLRYRRAEGIAEYIRAYVVNPKQAKLDAPNFTAYFEKTISPEGLKAVRDFSNDVRIWAGEDPLVRAGLNIRMFPPTITERLWKGLQGRGFGFEINPIDKLRLWFDDPYHYAVKAFNQVRELRGGALKPQDNFELQARLLSTHDSRMSDQFENGLTRLRPGQTPNAKGRLEVDRIVDPVTNEPMTMKWLLGAFDTLTKANFERDMRDASAFMVAERTMEKTKQLGRDSNVSGIGAGIMTDKAAAAELLRRVAGDTARQTRLKEAARRYRAWADMNLDMLVESGRMSAADAREIRRNNQQYVDMHRLSLEFEQGNRQQRGVKIGTSRDLIRRFKGSTLELDNVYSNLLEQTDSIQKEAFRNVAMNTFTDSLRNVRELHGANLTDFEQFGSKASSADANTITIYRNGKAEHWKFNPDIHESLKGLGELGSHAFIDILAMPSTFARYMITHGPQFLLRNPIRDTFQRSVVSANGSKPWDILRGYTREELSRYEVFGGGQFGNYIVDRHVWNRELAKVQSELTKDPQNIILSPLKLKRAWEQLSEKSEKLGRIAEFRRAFDKGKNELGYDDYNAALYAAGEARGLLDFAKAGTVMRVINRLVPFSNARIRGLARDAFAINTNPARFAMTWGLYVLAPTIGVMLWNRQDKETWEEYQQLPAYRRDFFWNFKVGPYWLMIPKPHSLGVMAGGVERAISRLTGDKRAMEGWLGSAASSTLPISDPVEGTGPLKTFLELEFNRDTFRDRDIVPIWERDLKLELRKGTEHASEMSKGIASAINSTGLSIDPRQIDYVAGSLGGAGQTLVNATKSNRGLTDIATGATGFSSIPVGSNARDVQWVMDWARKNGELGTTKLRGIQELRKAVMDEKDAVKRDAKAKTLREAATRLRDSLEKEGDKATTKSSSTTERRR